MNPHKLGKVFVSYSHRDKRWLDRLRVHLKPLERESFFDVWDDTRISAGQPWRPEIQKAVEAASAAVLLVSKHFLASDFIAENELPPLLEGAKGRGLTILPLIISPCRFEQTKSLGELQALNSPSCTLSEMTEAEQDRVFVNLTEQIHASLVRPVTELREKLQQKLRESDRKFEKEHRQFSVDQLTKEDGFVEIMRDVSQLDLKREIVMRELVELDNKGADRARMLEKGVTFPESEWACDEAQHEFLHEELEKLGRQRDQAIERGRAWREL